jgi:pyruvate formate lyase activating enzyme
MLIGGLQKTTLLDFPGKVAAIVFTKGCNYRCGYCHNPELISFEQKAFMPESEIFEFLKKRRSMLDGLAITGGEPLLQPDLKDFIKRVRELGLAVKLDTNGSSPIKLKKLIDEGLLEYVAMDYKYPAEKYEQIIGVKIDGNIIRQTRDIIMNSGVDYEFRVTIVEDLFSDDILKELSDELKGAKKVALQKFRPDVVYNKDFKKYKPTTQRFVERAKELFFKDCCDIVEIRG